MLLVKEEKDMFNVDAFLSSLLISGKGLLGVFIVIIAIVFAVFLLEVIFPQKRKKANK